MPETDFALTEGITVKCLIFRAFAISSRGLRDCQSQQTYEAKDWSFVIPNKKPLQFSLKVPVIVSPQRAAIKSTIFTAVELFCAKLNISFEDSSSDPKEEISQGKSSLFLRGWRIKFSVGGRGGQEILEIPRTQKKEVLFQIFRNFLR